MKLLDRIIITIIQSAIIFVGFKTAEQVLANDSWKPSAPVEFVVPVSCCVGGANDMARLIKNIVDKYNLMPQPLLIVNRPTGPASEGYVYLKNHRGNSHMLGIGITSIFTHSLTNPDTGFKYSDLSSVAMLALDQFVLWVPADVSYTSSKDFLSHVAANPGKVSVGGLGVMQEDQIVVAAMEQTKSVTFNYVAFRSGGEIALQLAGKHIDASVNNPSEGLQYWQAGKLRPLCVFDRRRIPNKRPIAGSQSWNDIPTCQEQGLAVKYKMMRTIFAPPGMPEHVMSYYQRLLRRITETPEWQHYLDQNALESMFLTDQHLADWLVATQQEHYHIMSRSGWLHKK